MYAEEREEDCADGSPTPVLSLCHPYRNSATFRRSSPKNIMICIIVNETQLTRPDFVPYLATILITLLLAVQAMAVELFRYRGAGQRRWVT